MFKETFRDSFLGQCIHLASGRKRLLYPEQEAGFVLPAAYLSPASEALSSTTHDGGGGAPAEAAGQDVRDAAQTGFGADVVAASGSVPGGTAAPPHRAETETTTRGGDASGSGSGSGMPSPSPTICPDRTGTGPEPETKTPAHEGQAQGVGKDAIVVDWYGPDDPENPQNWSTGKKVWLSSCIMLITAVIYAGSSIWAPAAAYGAEQWDVSLTASSLGIALFVFGYAVGPLLLSPISEIPSVGRTPPYIVTLAIFTVLQIGTVYVDGFPGFCVLRFLAGFAGSPPLATGGASLADIFAPDVLVYSFGCFAIAASAAPGFAPIMAGFAIEATGDWRWAFWEMFIMSVVALVFLVVALPETNAETILYRRARRLRTLTGNPHIYAKHELENQHRKPIEVLRETMLRPLVLTFTEPIIAALNLYVGLIYATIYSFFESFFVVFQAGYGWSLGISTLPFIALFIGAPLSFLGYGLHNKYVFAPAYRATGGRVKPELRLGMAIPGCFIMPAAILWFAWGAVRSHWINPVLAITVFGIAMDWVFMPALLYLPDAYPRYAASALASNDFVRSVMGAAMPIAGVPLFHNLGVAWGNTIIGLCAVLFIPLPFVLIKYGSWLRERSPISIHDSDIELPDEKMEGGAA